MSEPADLPRVPPEMEALLEDPRLADMKDALPNFPRTRRILDPRDPPKVGESRYLLFHDDVTETFGRLSWENKPQGLAVISHTGHGQGFGLLTERPRIKEGKRRPKSRVDVWNYSLWLVASPAFLEVLRRFDPDALETLDVDWSFVDGEALEGYVFLDIRRLIHAYDYARSRAVVEMEKGRKFVAWLAHQRALKADIDPAIHLFRDGYWRHQIFMSRALAKTLVEAGLRGFRFEDPVSVATVVFDKPKRAKKPVTRVPTPRAADNQWLVDLAEAANERPVMRVQGPLVDSILFAQETFDDVDPYAVIQATIDIANDLMLDGLLLPGEFPQQALWAYYVDYYRAQVAERGHAQFVHNSNCTPLTFGCCLRGFRALGAEKYLATFQKLIAFVRGSDEQTIDAELFGDVAPERSTLKALDESHFDSPDLVSQLDEWLRALECVRVGSLEDYARIKDERARLNPLREQRLAARELAGRDARAAAERVIAILCESARLGGALVGSGERVPMREVSAAAPDRRAFRLKVTTGDGGHHAFFYEAPRLLRTELRAELWNEGAPRAIASTTLSSAEYRKIVPDYLSRRALAELSAWQLT